MFLYSFHSVINKKKLKFNKCFYSKTALSSTIFCQISEVLEHFIVTIFYFTVTIFTLQSLFPWVHYSTVVHPWLSKIQEYFKFNFENSHWFFCGYFIYFISHVKKYPNESAFWNKITTSIKNNVTYNHLFGIYPLRVKKVAYFSPRA